MIDPLAFFRSAVQTAQNAAELVRLGGLETTDESSPFDVMRERATFRLRRYYPEATPSGATPIVLVPPLMMATEVWDVSRQTSAVRALHAAGFDPWVVDFGRPDEEPGGLERTLTDHVLAVDEAIEAIVRATGRDVVVGGYSQGGMFGYQAVAFRGCRNVKAMVTFGSLVDLRTPFPLPIPPEKMASLGGELARTGLLKHMTLPAWGIRMGFHMMSPAKTLQSRAQLLMALRDRTSLLPRERQRRFLETEGWTAYPGPAIAELVDQLIAHNRMVIGGFSVEDRMVTLADLDVPILAFVGLKDNLAHPASVRAIRRAAPKAEVFEVTLNVGHFGLVVGSTATEKAWPSVIAWLRWLDTRGVLPDGIKTSAAIDSSPYTPEGAMAALDRVADVGIGAGRLAFETTKRALESVRLLARDAPEHLPRLSRIDQLGPRTRISLASLLDERAHRAPDEICIVAEDRAFRQKDVKHRVDSVVRGLLSLGIRHGDRVGVLMETRPSAFAVTAALSRLGCTAVLLRPDGDLALEARLTGVAWVISDPMHHHRVDAVPTARWATLGSGDGRKPRPANVVALESVDPESVAIPEWYAPNPQRSGDTAFILFTGEGSSTRALEVTNYRWALSALGAATAAALKPGHTVYSRTPLHHSACLLMVVGGALASGARFAIASDTDPDTFWTEVRRYGATHVAYTWASLAPVLNAPPHPYEQSHPIRMFMGSGMPRQHWRRTMERFPDATILEFYASVEGEATLVNVAGRTPGCIGKALPGTAEVRVARFDLETRSLVIGPSGLARECADLEPGLLLERVDPGRATGSSGLRGLFEPDDMWRSTDDLCRRDAQGNHWFEGRVRDVVRTRAGAVLSSGACVALAAIPAVDLAVGYGVYESEDIESLVAAVSLRQGATLTASDLDEVLLKLPWSSRPLYVQVTPSIPVTTWGRPSTGSLVAAGPPKVGNGTRVWVRDSSSGRYRELDAKASRR